MVDLSLKVLYVIIKNLCLYGKNEWDFTVEAHWLTLYCVL